MCSHCVDGTQTQPEQHQHQQHINGFVANHTNHDNSNQNQTLDNNEDQQQQQQQQQNDSIKVLRINNNNKTDAIVEPTNAANNETDENKMSMCPSSVQHNADLSTFKAPNSLSNGICNGQSEQPKSNLLNGTRCNLTLVLHEKLRMELEQRPLPPKPKANEVTLATHTVGICGSDVKYWQQGKIGNFVLTKPMILGHETSAIVIETGESVTNLQPGDKVAVEVGLPCSSCSLCRSGKYNLCTQMAFAATPPYDGTLTRYFNHPANFCFKLPESVSLEEGALLEPMAVAVHACQRAPIKLGDIVLVCGAGAVGLLSMLTARAYGASQVIITDVMESRLAFARQLGANATFAVTKNESAEDLAQKIRQFAAKVKPDVSGVDVVLECSGAEASLRLAIQSCNVGGQIVCVGCQPDTVNIPLNCAIMQEIDVKGVFRYRNCYPLALSLVESGRINLRPLVTHRFRLEDSIRAFETCCRGEGVKIMIKCMDDKLKLTPKEAE